MSIVPTHPVTTPDPATLRWIIPDGVLPFAGEVASAPALLQALLDDGTLAAITVEPGAVLTMLGAGREWAVEGARVRAALMDGLGVPRSWKPAEQARALGPDEALRAAAEQIAAEVVGPYARSHGGQVHVGQVSDGVVWLEMSGACDGCPAAVMTAKARFERLLRRRCPWLQETRLA